MSEDKGYNGWQNYETWSTALWIDNDYDSYKFAWREAERVVDIMASDMASGKTLDIEEEIAATTYNYARWLLVNFWSVSQDLETDDERRRINWDEIAEGYITEAFDQWQKDNG